MARKAPAPTPTPSPAPTPANPPSASLRIRMYRQGLGDCFLVSLIRQDRTFHMMIDCGVILGTADAGAKLRAVVADIAKAANGVVDILVVTHEHYDHVAGFVLADDLFTTGGAKTPGKLAVGEVWFAWTEDPDNALAKRLRAGRQAGVAALAALAARMSGLRATDQVPETADALRFFGVDKDGSGLGATAQAMVKAKGFGGKVAYRRPGERIEPAGAPELAIYVLGPPQDEAAIHRTDAESEVYHLALEGRSRAVLAAAAANPGGDGSDPFLPFDRAFIRPLSAIRGAWDEGQAAPADDPTAAFIRERYLGPRNGPPDQDLSWRRIDSAWLDGPEQLALALDSATNNTSLVLAIEVKATRQVLLFAADAQVGNWLSWDGVPWDPGVTTTAADLLGRTVFYKVGHHGSHNATLKQHGLEEMRQLKMAFIPVDHAMAVKKRWGQMPLPGLVEALKQRCGDGVIRVDEPPPAGLAGVTAGPGGPAPFDGPLYVDWVLPIDRGIA